MMILLEQLPAWVWLVPALPLFAVIVNGARVLLGRNAAWLRRVR